MAVIGNTTGAANEPIVSPEQNGSARRKLQLFRNGTTATSKENAKALIDDKKSTLLDGEVIIARYNGGKDGILAIKSKETNEIVYFDSAALSDALQSVQGGTGISASTKENNSQVISLDIANAELSNGVITVKEKTPAEGSEAQTIFTISGVTADNVTYTGATSGLTSGSTTVDAAIEKLDDELIKANKANLTGATVSAEESKATVTFKNSNNDELSKFTVESTDANLAVAADGTTGITLDIKSVGATATGGTGTISGDTDAADALTQKSYVDNEIAKAKKTAAVTVASNKSDDEGATLVEFKKVGTEADAEKYYVNMTVGEGSDATVYNIELDAKNFVRDSFLAGAKTGFYVDPEDGTTQAAEVTKETEGAAAYIELTMKTITDPDPATGGTSTLSYIYVKTSDILGDINGGNGISFDGSTVSVDLAENATGNTYVQLVFTGDKLDVNVDQANVSGTTDENGKKTWAVSGDDIEDNNLASAENLAGVANDLQGQIDAINGKQNSGSTAITITTGTTGDVIALKLDDSTTEVDTIGGKAVGQYVGTTSNALAITADGLYLSNVWDCGEF